MERWVGVGPRNFERGSWSGYERVGTQEAGSIVDSNRVQGEILRSARTREDKDSSYYSGTGQSRTNPTKLKYFADGFKGREIFHEIYFETIQIKYIIHAPLLYTHTDAVR